RSTKISFYASLPNPSDEGRAASAVPLGSPRIGRSQREDEGLRAGRRSGSRERIRCVGQSAAIGNAARDWRHSGNCAARRNFHRRAAHLQVRRIRGGKVVCSGAACPCRGAAHFGSAKRLKHKEEFPCPHVLATTSMTFA